MRETLHGMRDGAPSAVLERAAGGSADTFLVSRFTLPASSLVDHRAETGKEARGIVRTGRGLRVILHAEDGLGLVAHALDGLIVEVDAIDHHLRRQWGRVDREAVVLRRD